MNFLSKIRKIYAVPRWQWRLEDIKYRLANRKDLRSAQADAIYHDFLKTDEAKESIHSFKCRAENEGWFIMANNYPYDRLLADHTQLAQYVYWYDGRASEAKLVKKRLKEYLGQQANSILFLHIVENEKARQSVPEVSHIHIFVYFSA